MANPRARSASTLDPLPSPFYALLQRRGRHRQLTRWRSVRAPSAALGPPWHARTYPPRHRPVTEISTWDVRVPAKGVAEAFESYRTAICACGEPHVSVDSANHWPRVDGASYSRRRDRLNEPTISNVRAYTHRIEDSCKVNCEGLTQRQRQRAPGCRSSQK